MFGAVETDHTRLTPWTDATALAHKSKGRNIAYIPKYRFSKDLPRGLGQNGSILEGQIH